jgi:hypothetical protein
MRSADVDAALHPLYAATDALGRLHHAVTESISSSRPSAAKRRRFSGVSVARFAVSLLNLNFAVGLNASVGVAMITASGGIAAVARRSK